MPSIKYSPKTGKSSCSSYSILVIIQIKETFYLYKLETEDVLSSFMSIINLSVDEVDCANKWFFAIFMTMSWQLMQAYYGAKGEGTIIKE